MVRTADGPVVRLAATYLRLHGFDVFVVVVAAAGCLGFVLAKVPLPQATEQAYGDYTRLTAFHILPLLLAPIAGFVLVGAAPQLEQHSARSLHLQRCRLLSAATAVACVALLPASAAINPNNGDNAIHVSTENTLIVLGAAAILVGWIDRAWSWFPIVAVGAAGLTATDHSTLSALALVDRTADDTTTSLIVWIIGAAHYTMKGAYRPASDTRAD